MRNISEICDGRALFRFCAAQKRLTDEPLARRTSAPAGRCEHTHPLGDDRAVDTHPRRGAFSMDFAAVLPSGQKSGTGPGKRSAASTARCPAAAHAATASAPTRDAGVAATPRTAAEGNVARAAATGSHSARSGRACHSFATACGAVDSHAAANHPANGGRSVGIRSSETR